MFALRKELVLKKITLTLLLLFVLFLAGCRQLMDRFDAGGQSFVPYEDAEMGLALEYPQGWVAHTAFSGLTLASSQSVIDGASLTDIGDGAFVNVIPLELAVFGMQVGQSFSSDDPQSMVEAYRDLLGGEGQEFTEVEAPRSTTVDGQDVATMVVESSAEGATVVTILSVIVNGDFMALVSAGSLQDHFGTARPTLERIVDSITVSPPVSSNE
jgi:hypothetical protein